MRNQITKFQQQKKLIKFTYKSQTHKKSQFILACFLLSLSLHTNCVGKSFNKHKNEYSIDNNAHKRRKKNTIIQSAKKWWKKLD